MASPRRSPERTRPKRDTLNLRGCPGATTRSATGSTGSSSVMPSVRAAAVHRRVPARPTQDGRLACRRHRGRPPRPRARRADALLSAPRQEGRYLGLRAGRVLSGPVARRPDRQSERLTGAILDAEAPPLEGHEGTKRGAASSTVEPGVAWLPVTHRHSVAQPGSLTPSVGGTAGKGSGPWASQGLAASMCQPGERAG